MLVQDHRPVKALETILYYIILFIFVVRSDEHQSVDERATTTTTYMYIHVHCVIEAGDSLLSIRTHSSTGERGGGKHVIGRIFGRSVVQNGWPRVVQFEEKHKNMG